FIYLLPNELLIYIAEYLPKKSLRRLTQVSQLFREIASPRYFECVGFKPPVHFEGLSVNHGSCKALPVWRRTNAFMVPSTLWFTASRQTSDAEFKMLDVFFASLGEGSIRHVFLYFFSGPSDVMPSLVSLLESIQQSGCRELYCHGFEWLWRSRHSFTIPTSTCESRLTRLELHSSLLFSGLAIPFTLKTLQSAPLEKLVLTDTSLTATQWSSFLEPLYLPHLCILAVDDHCPGRSLALFLLCHQITDLSISSRAYPCTRPSQKSVTFRKSTILGKLSALQQLTASPFSIHSLMRHVNVSGNFQCLTIELHQRPLEKYLLFDALCCTNHFPGLPQLWVSVPVGVSLDTLAYPDMVHHFCLVQELTLQMDDSESDDIIVSYYNII
ncbi:hypothetical protein SCLCIDRAFT_131813, partial [Scleroderma citrinum Foug A]